MSQPTPETPEAPASRRVVLNIGCGAPTITRLREIFPEDGWDELRLDIDPTVEPDILASVTDMKGVPDASVDALWSSHNLEHLMAHEVPVALEECLRVLKPGGVAVIAVPDLQMVAARVAEDRLDEPLYQSEIGPITPLDVIYGHSWALATGRHFMAHRTGFTPRSLGHRLQTAGFDPVFVWRAEGFELVARAFRPPVTPERAEKESAKGPLGVY